MKISLFLFGPEVFCWQNFTNHNLPKYIHRHYACETLIKLATLVFTRSYLKTIQCVAMKFESLNSFFPVDLYKIQSI